ncbi:MAG: hypothetical protein OXG78_12675 [Chloroflexi bacterium]|nr:hypothetical protein [Chloroflexota bacterium]
MILLLGEKEALSYASRAALANGLDCCVATISRWRRQWKERGIIISQGYNIIRIYENSWEDRIPIFALPRFKQTVTVKYLQLNPLGQPRYQSETYTLEIGARAPPDHLSPASTTSSDFVPAQDFDEAS